MSPLILKFRKKTKYAAIRVSSLTVALSTRKFRNHSFPKKQNECCARVLSLCVGVSSCTQGHMHADMLNEVKTMNPAMLV
jgi:hypothetical protein